MKLILRSIQNFGELRTKKLKLDFEPPILSKFRIQLNQILSDILTNTQINVHNIGLPKLEGRELNLGRPIEYSFSMRKIRALPQRTLLVTSFSNFKGYQSLVDTAFIMNKNIPNVKLQKYTRKYVTNALHNDIKMLQ